MRSVPDINWALVLMTCKCGFVRCNAVASGGEVHSGGVVDVWDVGIHCSSLYFSPSFAMNLKQLYEIKFIN